VALVGSSGFAWGLAFGELAFEVADGVVVEALLGDAGDGGMRMRQRLRLGIATAIFGGVALIGSGALSSNVSAGSDCWYTGHGSLGTTSSSGNNNCGHRSIHYETWITNPDGHFHQYKHDVRNNPDHHPWKWISA
jgi:hypothetical protein